MKSELEILKEIIALHNDINEILNSDYSGYYSEDYNYLVNKKEALCWVLNINKNTPIKKLKTNVKLLDILENEKR